MESTLLRGAHDRLLLLATNRSATEDAEDIMNLNGWNRAFLISIIFLFIVLSIISGRIIFNSYYLPRQRRLRANSLNTGSSGAEIGKPSAYSTPKHGPSVPLLGNQSASIGLSHSNNGSNVVQVSANFEDESLASASTGAEMRQRFFLLLFIGSLLRVGSLIVEVSTLSLVSCDAAWYTRLLVFFIWVPSVLFQSMYGLVLLFWAQLCYACWGKAYPWPRRVFFLFNLLIYVLVCVFFFAIPSASGFWRACDLMMGVGYFVGLFAILYYSVRLIYFFRHQSPDDDFFFDLPTQSSPFRSTQSPRQVVLRRITAVCILLCILFAVKAVYLLGMGSGYIPSKEAQYETPLGVHHISFEFFIHLSTEFVPCALLIFFTRKQHEMTAGSASASVGGSSGPMRSSAGTGSKPATPNFSLRMRAGSSNNGASTGSTLDDSATTIGTGNNSTGLTGYQYQASQRAFSAANMKRSNSVGYTSDRISPSPSIGNP